MVVTNRLHVWDAVTRRELYALNEIDSLLHSYNSYAFGSSSGSKKDKTRLYAVGASDGTVIVWDLQRGVMINMLGMKPMASSFIAHLLFTNLLSN